MGASTFGVGAFLFSITIYHTSTEHSTKFYWVKRFAIVEVKIKARQIDLISEVFQDIRHILEKAEKLRHSLGRPSRGDFVQFEFSLEVISGI